MSEKIKRRLLNILIIITIGIFSFIIFFKVFLIKNKAIDNEKQRLERQILLIGRQIENSWREFESEIVYNNSTGFTNTLLLSPNLSEHDRKKIKRFYAKYQNLIEKIEIYNDNYSRVIHKDANNYYQLSELEENKTPRLIHKNKTIHINGDNKCLHLPIYGQQSEIIGNLRIELNVKEFIKNIFSDYYIGRESWKWILEEGKLVDVIYSENSVNIKKIIIDNLEPIKKSIANNFKNITSHHINYQDKKAKILSAYYPVDISSERLGVVISSSYSVVIDKIQRQIFHIIAIFVGLGIFLSVIFFKMYKKVEGSENKFRRIIENMQDTFYRTDMNGEIQMMSPSGQDLFGYDPENLIGKKVDDVLYQKPEDYKGFMKKIEKRGKVESYELVLQDSKGYPVFVLASAKYVYNNSGKPVGIEGVLSDITLRKKTEAELEQKTTLLSNLLDSIPNIIYFKDREGRYLGCNYAFQKLTGLDKDEILHKKDSEIFPSETAQKFSSNDKMILNEKVTYHVEDWFEYPDGRSVLLDIIKAPLTTSDWVTIGLLGIGQDITEREEARQELKKARDKAEESARLKSEFLANMSHEIRTPMNSVIGFSELLIDEIDSKQGQYYIDSLQKAGDSLIELIDDILDLSKIEAGKMKIEYSYINVVDHLQFIINIFKPKADNKNLKMELDIDPQLPAEIFIDNQRLKQILFNLVGNAVKFTEEGYVKISARLAECKNDVLDIVFAVEDSGIGIPEDTQDIIFDSFRQKEGHDTREYGGTGLGLTITKKLANMMKGDVSVESEPGKGSIFTVLFKDVEYKQIIEEGEEAQRPSELLFEKACTMVVDDNDLNRDMLSDILKNEGLDVVTAKNGKEAIRIVKNDHLDLIFMDIKMPEMNGIDATRKIKKYQNGSPLPVIAFTAKNDQEFDQQYLDQVFDEFLRKPFPRKALMEILKKYLAYEVS